MGDGHSTGAQSNGQPSGSLKLWMNTEKLKTHSRKNDAEIQPTCRGCKLYSPLLVWAGIFYNLWGKGNRVATGVRTVKQSMGARNRRGIGLSYGPARLHRLAEFIP
jgi:hypothetical protein